MDRKRILITGSNGLLGQKLVSQLKVHKNFELIATSIGANRSKEVSNQDYYSLDITKPQEIRDLFHSLKPEIVINTAAMTNVDACESRKKECWELNVLGVGHLVEACHGINAHLIQLSTDFVFDGEDGPYDEDAQPNPISYYGQSKFAAEKIIQESDLKKWSIVRTIILYGFAEDMSRSNIVLWAKEALEKGNPIDVVDDQFRSPTLVEDLADGCIAIASRNAQGIYHLSGEETMSILELVNKVGDFFKLDTSMINPIKSEALGQAAKRPPVTGFNINKAKQELGYSPKLFIEGLEILSQQLEGKEQL